jgi:hypothetical protein
LTTLAPTVAPTASPVPTTDPDATPVPEATATAVPNAAITVQPSPSPAARRALKPGEAPGAKAFGFPKDSFEIDEVDGGTQIVNRGGNRVCRAFTALHSDSIHFVCKETGSEETLCGINLFLEEKLYYY